VAGAFEGFGAGNFFGINSMASHAGALYVGGMFDFVDGATANNIASWSGGLWAPLGVANPGIGGPCHVLSSRPDGLYVGGAFNFAGGLFLPNLVRWNAGLWQSVGGGTNGSVSALAWWDDGLGGAENLYVGGDFTQCGGNPGFNRLGRWDGAAWSVLGTGVPLGAIQPTVRAIRPYDDGSGSKLYVGGSFTSAGGVGSTNRMARWTGAAWEAVPGLSSVSTVNALLVHDDGCGDGLYAGAESSLPDGSGSFTGRVARYDGGGWETLGGAGVTNGDGTVLALAAHAEDGIERLFAAGYIQDISGVTSWASGEWINCACVAIDVPDEPPATHRLRIAAQPNPSRGGTVLTYALPQPARVRISVHSVTGARVRVLFDGHGKAGELRAQWDGRDDAGAPVRPGVYWAKLEVEGTSASARMVRVR
jgi:hypothetical protein